MRYILDGDLEAISLHQQKDIDHLLRQGGFFLDNA